LQDLVKAVEVKEEDKMISLHMGAGGQELQVRGKGGG
jgi:hypothetical protein